MARQATVLFTLRDLTDEHGNALSMDEIVPDTIRLNYILPPQPWQFKRQEKTVIILRKGVNPLLRQKKEGFMYWVNQQQRFDLTGAPFMLVRFNLFDAMATLPDMVSGNQHPITVTGELNDGRLFRGTADITLTSWEQPFGGSFNFLDWLKFGDIMSQWWNR